MYSQFYSPDLDCWNIWSAQTDSKPVEDYMNDDLDDVLIKGAQEVAVEKPTVADEVVEESESDNDQEGGANLPLLPSAGKLTL